MEKGKMVFQAKKKKRERESLSKGLKYRKGRGEKASDGKFNWRSGQRSG